MKKIIIGCIFLFFIHCGFVQKPDLSNPLNNKVSEQNSNEIGGSGSSSRSSSSGRYRSRDDDDDDDDDDHDHDIEDLHRIIDSDIDVTSLIDTAVVLYSIIGQCDSESNSNTHKTCVTACLRARTTDQIKANCITTCNTTSNCKLLSGICSGVFQSNSKILTNHHCIDADIAGYTDPDDNKYYYSLGTVVENESGQQTSLSEVKWYDTKADIALVELDESLSNAEIPTFGSVSDLSLLDELFTIGAPDGLEWTASLGHLTNKNPPSTRCKDCIFFLFQ